MVPDVSMAAASIRAANAAELPAVRRIVPSLFGVARAPDRLLVCVDEAERKVIGVAAIAWNLWGAPPGFPLWVHVLEGYRRRGHGRALLAAAAHAARSDAAIFHAWSALDEHDEGCEFLRAVGFAQLRRTLHYEADGATFFAMIAGARSRLARRGRIPADARTVPLRDAPYAGVAHLVSSAFGTRHEVALAATRNQRAGGYDRDRSVVLMVGEDVRGALLYRWANGVPEIDVNVVGPGLRRGWANVLLLHDATRNGLEGGASRFRFHCEDRVLDTINLARRSGAKLLRTSVEWSARIGPLIAG